MTFNVADLERQYAGMSENAFELLVREDLTAIARACYDREAERRIARFERQLGGMSDDAFGSVWRQDLTDVGRKGFDREAGRRITTFEMRNAAMSDNEFEQLERHDLSDFMAKCYDREVERRQPRAVQQKPPPLVLLPFWLRSCGIIIISVALFASVWVGGFYGDYYNDVVFHPGYSDSFRSTRIGERAAIGSVLMYWIIVITQRRVR